MAGWLAGVLDCVLDAGFAGVVEAAFEAVLFVAFAGAFVWPFAADVF